MPPYTKAPGEEHTRAAIYLRVSTEEQATAGYGLDVQRDRCLAMATVKGWQVEPIHIYADEGLSGTKDATGRPALAALLAAVEIGNVDAVIVLSFDRLGRKTRIVLDLVDRLSASGCQLVSCKESLDTSTPAGSFVLTIFAALAQLERDTIVERTTSGRNARGKKDGEKGGRLPFGYVRTPEGISVDLDRAALVKRIFRRRNAGATLRAIAGDLPGPGPRGGRWHPSSVAEVLANVEAYQGGARGESAVRWPTLL
jgi:site-specific DNA recombinase